MVLCMLTGTVVIVCSMLAQVINERIDPRLRGARDSMETEAAQ